jgi:hypothetical protein
VGKVYGQAGMGWAWAKQWEKVKTVIELGSKEFIKHYLRYILMIISFW